MENYAGRIRFYFPGKYNENESPFYGIYSDIAYVERSLTRTMKVLYTVYVLQIVSIYEYDK